MNRNTEGGLLLTLDFQKLPNGEGSQPRSSAARDGLSRPASEVAPARELGKIAFDHRWELVMGG